MAWESSLQHSGRPCCRSNWRGSVADQERTCRNSKKALPANPNHDEERQLDHSRFATLARGNAEHNT